MQKMRMSIVLLCAVRSEDGGFAPVDEQGNKVSAMGQIMQVPSEFAQGAKHMSLRLSVGLQNMFHPRPLYLLCDFSHARRIGGTAVVELHIFLPQGV